MTLAQIRSWVQDKLGDTAFETTLIDSSANWFVQQLFANTRTRLMEANDQLFGSAGDTEIDLPDDLQTLIKEGLYLISPQVWDMGPYFMEYGDFMKTYPGYASYTASLPYQWTDFNNAMRLAAPLSADVEINCDYIRKPVDMVAATSICEVPDNYQELVVLGTLIRCMNTNEDYGEAASENVNLQALITAFIRNEGRGQLKTGPTNMRTNRRRRGGYGGSGGWSAADY